MRRRRNISPRQKEGTFTYARLLARVSLRKIPPNTDINIPKYVFIHSRRERATTSALRCGEILRWSQFCVLIRTIFYSILITLIFTLSKPIGGILFGVAFWTMAKDVAANKVVREYLIIAGFGLIMLFISDQAITQIAVAYPPFGLVRYHS